MKTTKKYDVNEALTFSIERLTAKIHKAKTALEKNFCNNFESFAKNLIKDEMRQDRLINILQNEPKTVVIAHFMKEAEGRVNTMAVNNSTCIFANAQTQAQFEFFREFRAELAELQKLV